MRRLFALFVILTLSVAPVFSQKKEVYRVRTVVIDPGHGGAKPGARGACSLEKDITLSVAKKFGQLISDNYPNVKVIYTRTTDVDISLSERAHIANRNKADLFISIHANSHPTNTPTGVETFVMGLSESRANLEVAKKENADILLEADYKTNDAYKGFDPNSPESYVMFAMFQNAFLDKSLNFAQAVQNQYKQNLKTINRGVKQAELYVLYKTTCPSVLTEVGFISNPNEEAFMLSDEGQAKIAISLFNAFMNFKAAEEGSARIANPKINLKGYKSKEAGDKETKKQEEPEVQPEVAEVKQEVPAEPPAVQPQPVAEQVSQPAPESKPAPEAKTEPKPQPEIKPEPKPTPKQEPKPEPKIAPEPEPIAVSKPTPKTAPEPARTQSALAAPANTIKEGALIYYTVQFVTSGKQLDPQDPALGGVQNVECYKKGNLFCYSSGRFATYQDASKYCDEIQAKTPFEDAWVTSRKIEDAIPASTSVAKPASKPTAKSAENPAPVATTSTPARNGMVFTVQFASTPRLMKAGDPDLSGIRDFKTTRSGRFYVYTAGRYSTREEADKRCAEIKAKTPFKDAIVVEVKKK